MSRQKIIITEFMDQAAVDGLTADFDVTYDPGLGVDPDRLYPMLAEADGLIVRTSTQVRRPLLEAGRKLQCIGRLGVGLDNFDLEACADFGVPVFPSIGANALSVAEYVVTTASALLRGAYYRNDQMLAGAWPRGAAQGAELAGKRLGIIGYGSVGRVTADLCAAMGMTVAAVDPYVEAADPAWKSVERFEDQDALLGWADVLSLHVPLTAETRDLVDGRGLALMQPDAVLVNAARGGVVNEAALAEALKDGVIAGAAVDVFAAEPLSAEDAAKFAGISNLILTPHIAGVTRESNARVSAMTADQVRAVLEKS